MPYGVKRGFKSPGEFGVGDMAGLALSGAAGIIAALVTDYQQQGEASALFTINQWVVQVGSLLGYTDIPLLWVVLGLTAVGAGSIFYFQPITRQGAFAQGFGLLAVLMTTVPADLAGGIESFNDNLPGLEPASLEASVREASFQSDVDAHTQLAPATMAGAKIVKAAFRTESAATVQLIQDEQQAGPAKYDLHLTINFPSGIPDDLDSLIRRGAIRGRLHNEGTNETWSLFRSSGGTVRREGDRLVIHAGVPARQAEARLWVRVEAPGYLIEVQSKIANLNGAVEWDVTLEESDIPLFVQRLGKSYWF